jgi:adenylate cyclase, class 2
MMRPDLPENDIVDDSVGFEPDVSPQSAVVTSGSENLEVEVKFLVADLALVRRRLLNVGAEIKTPRGYERNVRFDTAGEDLLAKLQLLRLRQDDRVRLTFKGPVAEDAVSEAKIREEIEVTVGDFDSMVKILERLGFHPKQTYEKYRETFRWRDVEVMLDETPFGDFVEIEGAEAGIRTAAAKLGLDWSRRVLANYLALMELARCSFGLSFADLTFANFADQPVSLAGLLPVCVLHEVER